MQRPDLSQLIRCAPDSPDAARAEWTGQTRRAQFEASAVRDRAATKRRTFGKRRPDNGAP
jgi:hypothetical protein